MDVACVGVIHTSVHLKEELAWARGVQLWVIVCVATVYGSK